MTKLCYNFTLIYVFLLFTLFREARNAILNPIQLFVSVKIVKRNVRLSRPLAKYNGYSASNVTVRSTKRVSAESTDIFGNWSCSNCSDKTVCQLCYEEDPPEDTCYDEDEDEDIDWAQCDNCKHWFHQFCIGCRVDKSMNWICPLCISRKSQIKE